MATCNWLSRAAARAQVSRVTPANVEVGDIFTLTINGKSISVTATAATVANVIGLFVTAWNASTIAEFAEITASDGTTYLILTGDTAGVPFTVTSSATDGGVANTQTLSVTTPTAATGPNHWNDANNWDSAAVPVNADDVNVDITKGSILYGMDQSAVTLTSLRVFRSAQTQNRLGLPLINALQYTEYREPALKIGATAAIFDADVPYAVNFGSVAVNAEVRAAAPSSPGDPQGKLSGTNAANVWEFVGGYAALGLFPGDASAGATLRVGRNASLVCGPDVSIVDITNGGQLEYFGDFTTYTNEDGQASVYGAQAASTLDIHGGTVFKRFSGTVAAGTVDHGTLDCSFDLSPATFTDLTLGVGGQVVDPNETLTINNGLTLDFGVNSVSAA